MKRQQQQRQRSLTNAAALGRQYSAERELLVTRLRINQEQGVVISIDQDDDVCLAPWPPRAVAAVCSEARWPFAL